jgi:hypothetical protein
MGVNQYEGSLLMLELGLPEFLSKTQPNITYQTYMDYMNFMFKYIPRFPTLGTAATKDLIVEKYANWANLNNVKGNLLAMANAYGDTLM